MYDVTINKVTIKRISWSPILYAISAIWFYSNQQIFRNTVIPLENQQLFPASGHKFYQLFTQITPGTPFIIFVLLFPITELYQRCSVVTQEIEAIEDQPIDQMLPNFFDALQDFQKNIWLEEELVCSQRLDIPRINQNILGKLKSFSTHNKI